MYTHFPKNIYIYTRQQLPKKKHIDTPSVLVLKLLLSTTKKKSVTLSYFFG